MKDFFDQYAYFRSRGPFYKDEADLPTQPSGRSDLRFVAYYLPQFHAIPENDEWWGHGFTEWNNVAGALPRYAGHYQPRTPAHLGFYDLSDADIIRTQAALAKRGGIHGFCIHDYWFSGKKLLEKPLNTLLRNPDIDLPFCLNWANESWSRRWDGSDTDMLIEQHYSPGEDVGYAASIIPAISDKRYITIDGRPLVMIYRPNDIPNPVSVIENMRNFLVKEGFPNPYMVMAQARNMYDPREYGMDAAAGFPPHGTGYLPLINQRRFLKLFDSEFEGTVYKYDVLVERILQNVGDGYPLFPCVCPDWDNEARKPGKGTSYLGSTPDKYMKWLESAAKYAMANNPPAQQIVFINAWNEWAEGAYLEPDRHNGFAYLVGTRKVVDHLASGRNLELAKFESSQIQSGMQVFLRKRLGMILNKRSNLYSRMQGFFRKILAKFNK